MVETEACQEQGNSMRATKPEAQVASAFSIKTTIHELLAAKQTIFRVLSTHAEC